MRKEKSNLYKARANEWKSSKVRLHAAVGDLESAKEEIVLLKRVQAENCSDIEAWRVAY